MEQRAVMTFVLRRLLGIALLFAIATFPENASAQTVRTTYQPTDEIFVNPERGFYKHREVQAEGSPLTVNDLRSIRDDEGITLILRLYYLKSFRDEPLSERQLDLMQQDFARMREAGVKAVLRFAYSQSENQSDAPLETIIEHLDQLRPIFHANSDVIATVQAGFIGAWGEWYYSSNNLNTTSARRAVTEKILSVLPESRTVQIRTPYYKKAIFNRFTPLRADEAFRPDFFARTGHHNDCFLASDTDYGTYENLNADKAYLEDDTRFTPMGGETCNPNPPRSACGTALEELARFHWSYLNRDYNRTVLGSWTSGGCMEDVQRRLGYRLALLESDLTSRVHPGGAFSVDIEIVNDGWAAPFNARGVELILRERGSGHRYAAALDEDVRFWSAGDTTSINAVLGIPKDAVSGTYDVLLYLPDASGTLRERPEYAIRLANEDIWEPNSGYNDLKAAVTIDADAEGEAFEGERWFQPYEIHIGVRSENPVDAVVGLSSAYPNPFRTSTSFDMSVTRTQYVQIEAFDIAGRRVSTLHEGVLTQDRRHLFHFDGERLAGGVYIVRASGADFAETLSVILSK